MNDTTSAVSAPSYTVWVAGTRFPAEGAARAAVLCAVWRERLMRRARGRANECVLAHMVSVIDEELGY